MVTNDEQDQQACELYPLILLLSLEV